MDDTGQPGADANGAGERDGTHDGTPWPANNSSEDALPGWGQYGADSRWPPVGTARVRADNTSIRPRADLRTPYSDLIAPISPPARPTDGVASGPGAEEHPNNLTFPPLNLPERAEPADDFPYGDRRVGRASVDYRTPYSPAADNDPTAAGHAPEVPMPAAPSLPAAPSSPEPPGDRAGTTPRPPLSLVPPLAEPTAPPAVDLPQPATTRQPQPPVPPFAGRPVGAAPVDTLPEPAAHPLPAAYSYPPLSDAPAADAGRHSEPVGGQYSDEPEQQVPQSAAPGGRHVGEESTERSPWAPASLPPGYERIPIARTSPPPEYEETPVYRESAASTSPYSAISDPVAPPEPIAQTDSPWHEPRWPQPSLSEPAGSVPGWPERPSGGPRYSGLPQRVPSAPDVPDVPGLPEPEQEPGGLPAAAPELARIATYLRDEDDDGAAAHPDGFEFSAVLAAVRGVPGVRDAQLRANASGAQTLRLELAEDADPGEVSRAVTRLLNERMGLAAEPNDERLRAAQSAPAVPAHRRAPDDDEETVGRLRDESAYADDVDRRAEAAGGTSVSEAAGGTSVPEPTAEGEAARPQADQPGGTGLPEPGPGVTTSRELGCGVTEAREFRRGVTEARALGGRGARSRGVEASGSRSYRRGGDSVPLADPARESAPAHRPLPGGPGAVRVLLDQVEVSTQGAEAVVEVRLSADASPAVGSARGPMFDGYVLRLAAVATANAVDELLAGADGSPRARCFIENATVVPMGNCEVAVVVLLLAHSGWVEELSGSAVVNGDQRQAVVRATLAAVNRRLEALLS
ncbi:hypothetical protein HC028_09380 [Planosporangium flavigriseum]|uniref:Uncharacterized protein n=1 Tax=Planosporangium flavigriseum TaxID=373681 RepID=A0A8J3LNR0_9ACTN|nr:hypothetical protein [Planosporangium flavigriseum]NJC64713.1 hypothetical protein [Planosporangium flavigriseum]GIG74060.1 hypothetical protein Pfl04_24640 [Planosporangium flavigriseum]